MDKIFPARGLKGVLGVAAAVVIFAVGGCGLAFGSDPFADRAVPLDYPAALKAIADGRTVLLAVGVPAPPAVAGTAAARVATLRDAEPGVYVCWRTADGTPTFARLLVPVSAEAVGRVLAENRGTPFGTAPTPAKSEVLREQAAPGWHVHRCSQGHEWSHPDTSKNNAAAHACPTCGEANWVPNRTGVKLVPVGPAPSPAKAVVVPTWSSFPAASPCPNGRCPRR